MSGGLGFSYVPALVYINIRAHKYRAVKVALAHVWYIFGFAVGTTILIETGVASNQVFYTYSYFLMGFSGLLLLGYIINEILQFANQDYDYKVCLDHWLLQANNFDAILRKKYFLVDTKSKITDKPGRYVVRQQAGVIPMVLLGKLLNVMYFYYPFLDLSYLSMSKNSDPHLYICHYFGVAGVICSTILLIWKSPRFGLIDSCGLKIVFIVILTVLTHADFTKTRILFWFFYLCVGFGYSHPDINILELTNFAWTEVILTFGFIFEFVLIGAMHYTTIYERDTILSFTENAETFDVHIILRHSIAFGVVCLILAIIALFLQPGTHNLTVLEIKNLMSLKYGHSQSTQQLHETQPTFQSHRPLSRQPSFISTEQHTQHPMQHQSRAVSRQQSRQPTREVSPVSKAPSIYSVPKKPYPEHLRNVESSNYDYETVQPVTKLPRPFVSSNYNINILRQPDDK